MANNKHGMYGTPTYKSWSEMKCRCDHPSHSTGKYENVKYCERWSKFEAFFEDMGVRPQNTTLDRIDVNGNYEPSNCRWADILTQENNRSNNIFYDVNGKQLTLTQIARKYGISRSNLANKIYIYKWDMEYAISYLMERKKVMTYRRKKNVCKVNSIK